MVKSSRTLTVTPVDGPDSCMAYSLALVGRDGESGVAFLICPSSGAPGCPVDEFVVAKGMPALRLDAPISVRTPPLISSVTVIARNYAGDRSL